MATAAEILNLASQLSDSERAHVVHQLILSLEHEPFDDDCEDLWAAELEARMAAVDRGEYLASDWRDAMQRMRANLKASTKP